MARKTGTSGMVNNALGSLKDLVFKVSLLVDSAEKCLAEMDGFSNLFRG